MSVIKSFFSAFLMYSNIPMPQVEWCEENRRYSLCFFPLIGAVTGGLLLLWYRLCGVLSVGDLLFAAGAAAIPVLVTGGIHLDGFCDVCDALASCSSRETMLQIMSDPHIGAFAAIRLGLYFLLQAGVLSQMRSTALMEIAALCFVQSRAWSAIAAVTFRSAKAQGALVNFAKPAHKVVTVTAGVLFLAASTGAMLAAHPLCGTAAAVGGGLTFIYYRRMSYRRFGGITGDLAGYFLQLCELAGMAAAAGADLVGGVLK